MLRGVSGQIHQDVNPVLPDLLGNDLMAFSQCAVPVVCEGFDARRDLIGPSHIRIAEYLHPGLVMRLEQRFDEVGAGMAPKIRGDIPDAEPSFGRGVVLVGHHLPGEGLLMDLGPAEMLFQQPFRRVIRGVLQGEEQVAVRDRVLRLELQDFPITCHRVLRFAVVSQGNPHVVVCLGTFRLDLQDLFVTLDGFLGLALGVQFDSELIVGLDVVGFDLNGLPKSGDRLRRPADINQGNPHVVECLCMIRLELNRFAIRFNRLGRPAHIRQHDAHVIMRVHIILRELQCLAVICQRLLGFAHVLQRASRVVAGLGVVRLDLNRLFVAGKRVLMFLLRDKDIAPVVEIDRIFGEYLEGLVNQLHRGVALIVLMRDQPKQMQRVGVVRFDLEYLPVEELGLCCLSVLVVFRRALEYGVDVNGKLLRLTL